MNGNLRAPVSTAVALVGGWLTLFSILFGLEGLRATLLGWVMLVAAAGLLLGVLNLGTVHFTKLRGGSRNALYSFVLLVALFLTFVITAWLGPEAAAPQWLFRYIQLPVETSLMAVLAVTLTLAGARLLARRTDLFGVVFWVTALLALLGSGPLGDGLRPWLAQTLAGAGGRGILIGVSLGTIATGLRALLAADRPYGG